MESYQKAKRPPPVPPPKYHKLSSKINANSVYQQNHHHHHLHSRLYYDQKENVLFENGDRDVVDGYHHHYHQQQQQSNCLPSSTTSTSGALIQTNGMRVKIRINPENPVCGNDYHSKQQQHSDKHHDDVVLRSTSRQSNGNNVMINVNGTDAASAAENIRARCCLIAAAAVDNDMLLNSAPASCVNCNGNDYARTQFAGKKKFDYIRSHFDEESSTNAVKGQLNGNTPIECISDKGNGDSCDRTNVNSTTNGYTYCNNISSGQSSPSDNLDSGTCSDVETSTPPPPPPPPLLPPKMSSSVVPRPPSSQSPHQIAVHQRSGSLNSSGIGLGSDDDNDDDVVSCDSINSSDYNAETENTLPIISAAILKCKARQVESSPATIVNASKAFQPVKGDDKRAAAAVQLRPALTGIATAQPAVVKPIDAKIDRSQRRRCNVIDEDNVDGTTFELIDTDKYLHFHLHENDFENDARLGHGTAATRDDDTFAGYKSLTEKNTPAATIRSAKGTVRGVKNRVRAGIATFLNNNHTKTWQDKEAGKVVVYTTTMGIVRETYHRCLKVRQILRTHLVKFEEKDVFMSREVQKEMRERMNADEITVPQVFVEGIYIGDAEAIDRLNESGELRQILKPYKSADALSTCQVCGGYRLLPCNLCNGSKKSIHRNHFTTELVTLKCMNCDEVGLVKCNAC